MSSAISRRDALRLGLVAGGALGAASLGAASVMAIDRRSAPAGASDDLDEMVQPRMLRSRQGRLDVTLTATPALVDIGATQLFSTYTYDRIIPGYTWRLRPGDTLRVFLRNNLPKLSPEDRLFDDMTRPHRWTNTNLHTHGLHVSPEGNADNIFIDIRPGKRFHYEIAIPDDHPGGLFWYHPHRHGAVTQQVRAGMAGIIIVRGEIDDVPEVAAAQEKVMVLQALEMSNDFKLMDPIPIPSSTQAFFPRQQILYTVNGKMTPKITMYPGEVQRWRLLNAAEGKFMSLELKGHDLNAIAWDGLTLAEPEPTQHLFMAAGNRTDVLVKAGALGSYDLVLTPGSSQHPDIPGSPTGPAMSGMSSDPSMHEAPVILGELDPRPIATLVVEGNGPDMALPTSLPAFDPPILPIAATRNFSYTVQRGPDMKVFISFGVDGIAFDPLNPPYQMKLGTAEEWTLTNGVDPKYPLHAHGLHIHVNPFKITKLNGVALAKPMWRDTFVLTGTNGDSFTFEHNFTDFTGKFVEHCHVLAHEDLGMMEALEVIP